MNTLTCLLSPLACDCGRVENVCGFSGNSFDGEASKRIEGLCESGKFIRGSVGYLAEMKRFFFFVRKPDV